MKHPGRDQRLSCGSNAIQHDDELEQTRNDRTFGLRLFALSVLVLLTALLSMAASGDSTLRGDLRVQRFLQRAPEPVFRWLADFGNWIGSALVCALFGVAVVVVLLAKREPYSALIILLAFAARIPNALLKSLFDSPRPTADLVRIDEIAGGLGFPSGHAMGATLCFGSIALVAGRIMRPGFVRRSVQTVCALIIVVVGFGRVYVGAHWPSDVVGGYLYGVLFLICIDAFLIWLRHRYLPGAAA